MGPKPLLLTEEDLQSFYKLKPEQAKRLAKALTPRGWGLGANNPLFSRPEVEKAIKKGVHRA